MALDTRRNATRYFDLEGNIEIPRIPTINTPIGNYTVHPVTLSYLRWVYDQEYAHAQNIIQLREYYEGVQDSMLTDRQRKYLEVGHDVTFRLNAMPIPCDIMAERMRVIGFEVNDDSDSDPQSGDGGILWQWWQANKMDAKQTQIHKAAARDGDTFVIVGWDAEKQRPTIHHELAWDGSSGILVRYRADDRTRIDYAVKRWVVDEGDRQTAYMTVYGDSYIANYVGHIGGRDWVELPDENGVWPLAWVDNRGRPLGCPVFHAENNGDGTGYGRSELEDLIPLQNALDKCVIDELATADSAGFPVPWATGLNVGDDPTFAPGVFLSTESVDARFGSIQAANVPQLSDLVEKYIIRIAQLSRTPLTFFQITGQVARADTQKAGDSPLVSKVRARAGAFGNFWEDVMGHCRKLFNEFGGGNYPESMIFTQWDSFESIDVMQEDKLSAETKQVKAATLSQLMLDNPNADRVQLALLAGYDHDEAEVFAAPVVGFRDDGVTQ